MTVTTDTFGGVHGLAGEVASWDTLDPRTDPVVAGDVVLLDTMAASWSTDVLPPVAQPATVRFQAYMNGPDADGRWFPLTIGDPITVYAYAYREDLTEAEVFTFKGRVSDLSAVNVRNGGLIFTVVCADRLADLGSTNAPPTIDVAGTDPGVGDYALWRCYDQIADDAGITLDSRDENRYLSASFPYWDGMSPSIDLTNVSALDALSTTAAHDVRVSIDFTHTIDRWLCQQMDAGSTDPELDTTFATMEWDPLDVNDLAGALALHYDAPVWRVIPNPDYYDDGGVGMVLDAGNLARDVGEWRQTRDQAINTVEGTSPDVFSDGTQTKRATHDDLVRANGRNTRSVPDWWLDADDARAYLYEILLLRSQVQDQGFGFSSLLVAWETLTDLQLDAWATLLFPRGGLDTVGLRIVRHAPLGLPFTVVNIPDHWRLADGPAVTGRVMGATLTLSEGVVRVALDTRTVPVGAGDGITIDQAAAIGGTLTIDALDPTVSIDTFALVGPTAI